MQARPVLMTTLLALSFGCDGAYVLGDASHGSAGGSDGGQNESGGKPDPSTAAGAGNTAVGGASAGDAANLGGEPAAGSGTTNGIHVSPTSLPDARLNRAYVAQFAANGGTEPYAFRLLGGALPGGLTFDADGRLSGTPSEDGAFDLTVEATDAESESATTKLRLNVGRARWLAVETFPSSASTQTLLSVSDLLDPDAEPVQIEAESTHSATFSPNGRWLTYYSFRSLDAVDWYFVDLGGAAPTARQFLFTTKYGQYCAWAPDSSKLACPKQSTGAAEVVFFDARGDQLGPEVSLGAADRFAFVDADTLVLANGDEAYSRIAWNAGVPSEPQPFGLSAVRIQRQSPDGARAIVAGSSNGIGQALVDLKTGETAQLPQDPPLFISDSFDAAVSVTPSDADPNVATYAFYSLSGITWTHVGDETGELYSRYGQKLPLADNRMLLVQGSEVIVATIGKTSLKAKIVATTLDEVRTIRNDSNGRWFYIETAPRNPVNQVFVAAGAEHWLARVDVDAPVQLIGEDYLSGTAAFSGDGRRFYLHGYDTSSPTAVPFTLFDLRDPEAVEPQPLDLPFNWAESQWSPDSSFISFLGGTPAPRSRPLYVLDALAVASAPHKIFECFSNPAPLPGCPAIAWFQP